jgi:hypothetical protein
MGVTSSCTGSTATYNLELRPRHWIRSNSITPGDEVETTGCSVEVDQTIQELTTH